MSLPLKISQAWAVESVRTETPRTTQAAGESFTDRHCRDSNCRDLEFPTSVKVTKRNSVLIQKVRAYVTPEGI